MTMDKQQITPAELNSRISVALQRNQMKFDEANETFEFIKQGTAMLVAMHASEKIQLEEKIKQRDSLLKQYDDFLAKHQLKFEPDPSQPNNSPQNP